MGSKLRQSMIEKIVDGTITNEELYEIRDEYDKFLDHPLSTIHTYYRQALVRKVSEHYPNIIDPSMLDEFAIHKRSMHMADTYDITMESKKITPNFIRLTLNFMMGKDDAQITDTRPQIVINTIPPLEDHGSFTMPEPKRVSQ